MHLLSYWLFLVGFFRLSSVFFGYFNKWALQVAVFSHADVTDVHGRTFAVWTSVTCVLCVLTALDISNSGLYLATLLSFVIVLLFFGTEYLIYQTMSLKNISLVGTIAVVSLVWMAMAWKSISKKTEKPIKTT